MAMRNFGGNIHCRIWYDNNLWENLTREDFLIFNTQSCHRNNGPAIEFNNCNINWWYRYGKRHRIDGPAVEYTTGVKKWYYEDKLHRLYGPAVEFENIKEWWIFGKLIPTNEIETWVKDNKINLETDEGKLAFKLRWI